MENTWIGPFQVFEKLGAHRRHHVYRAIQAEQDREVALKFIKLPPEIDHDTAIGKINREVAVLKRLEHPHLVRMYGAGAYQDQVFFAHELIKGETVAAVLSRRGRLAPDQVIEYGRQVADLLDFLHHKEIIHNKLTTDKLIIDDQGRIKVSDLRLNRSRRRRWDAARRATLETAAYMPPEQLLGEGCTPKSDLYSLGVIMYEMVTGKLPFQPQTMAQLARDKQSKQVPRVAETVMNCPGWLDKLIRKMILPDPRRRPHSARAVLMTLDQIRSVDQSGTAAAEEITRGFSALSAGVDRTAARRALGMRKAKREPEQEVPLLQSVPFLLSGLGLIALIFAAVLFWPFGANHQEMMTEANLLMQSPDSDDWRQARSLYTRIMENSSDQDLRADAESRYYQARQKSMVRRLQGGLAPLEKPLVRELYAIMQNQQQGKLREARAQYQRLVDKIDPEDRMRYVRMEALDRLGQIQQIQDEATGMRTRYEQLLAGLDPAQPQDPAARELEQLVYRIRTTVTTRDFLADLIEQLGGPLDGSLVPPPDSGAADGNPGETAEAGREPPPGPENRSSSIRPSVNPPVRGEGSEESGDDPGQRDDPPDGKHQAAPPERQAPA